MLLCMLSHFGLPIKCELGCLFVPFFNEISSSEDVYFYHNRSFSSCNTINCILIDGKNSPGEINSNFFSVKLCTNTIQSNKTKSISARIRNCTQCKFWFLFSKNIYTLRKPKIYAYRNVIRFELFRISNTRNFQDVFTDQIDSRKHRKYRNVCQMQVQHTLL